LPVSRDFRVARASSAVTEDSSSRSMATTRARAVPLMPCSTAARSWREKRPTMTTARINTGANAATTKVIR
jgi:hypothetical protein